MYSFEGNYRNQRSQSLGGASRGLKAEKAALIAQAQAKRLGREQYRKEINSALVIQSFYRGSKVREKLRAVERGKFDTIAKATLRSHDNEKKQLLLQKLTFFYKLSIDDERLILICQLLLENPASFIQHFFTHDGNILLLKKLLLCCCTCIQDRSGTAAANISIPLRTLDCFTNVATFSNSISIPETAWAGLCQFLVCHGYFKVLRKLCDTRLPSSIERSATPPTPLAECILSLILRPMAWTPIRNEHYQSMVLSSFCANFFSPAYTHQVYDFIVPAVADEMSKKPTLLACIVSSISHAMLLKKSCQCTTPLSSTLLHSLLFLAAESLGSSADVDITEYLHVLSRLFPQILTDDFESELRNGTVMQSTVELVTDCLQRLNSPKHVEVLILMLSRSGDSRAISAVCDIGHMVLVNLQQHVYDSRLLYTLCYNSLFMRSLWNQCLKVSVENTTGGSTPLIQLLMNHSEKHAEDVAHLVPLLSVFCSLFSHKLLLLHDVDFYGDSAALPNDMMPFTIAELVTMVGMLRDVCLEMVNLAVPEKRRVVETEYHRLLNSRGNIMSATNRLEWIFLFKATSQLVRHLYDRDTRRSFCPVGHWQSNQASVHHRQFSRICKEGSLFSTQPLEEAADMEYGIGSQSSLSDLRSLVILQELPFVLSFQERVKIFLDLVRGDKDLNQIDSIFSPEACININLRRTHLYEDAFEKLSARNENNLKRKIRVHMLNVAGLQEAGIDGGGLFREFMTDLLKTAFDPNRGFFTYASNKTLYPNPLVSGIVDSYPEHFFFIGRMVGKALYEHMLVELPLASFFLSKLLGKSDKVDFHHLASLDPEMYKNLLLLRNYDGDVAELGLDFTVSSNILGVNKAEDLKPGGRDISVTSNNVIEYIHLMADYILNRQIRNQCHAFMKGIEDVISIDWLRMFNPHELQTLISGAPVPINVDDLRRNTNYSGGYTDEHPVIVNFWRVVSRFDDRRRRLLLKFVTSCSRPPLLGFKELFPAFCIHHGGSSDRLPTSSTCMNLLKLPEYKDEMTLEERLTYAIESGSGFELS